MVNAVGCLFCLFGGRVERSLAYIHPTGTASMMARDLGGVVDSDLKVYGTQNVRVVAASVLPFQLSDHQSHFDSVCCCRKSGRYRYLDLVEFVWWYLWECPEKWKAGS